MFKIFDLDGKFYQYALKYSELLWVSILTVVCSIPVVTIGASFTAMHKLIYQIKQGEEGKLTATFFRAFRDNFRQATLIWLLFAGFAALIFLDYRLVLAMPQSPLALLSYALPVLVLVAAMCLVWAFVLQSRYHNTVFGTVKLAFIVAVTHPLQTISMLVLFLLPFLVLIAYMAYAPLAVGVVFPLCGLLRAMIYGKVFGQLEYTEESEEAGADENGTEG